MDEEAARWLEARHQELEFGSELDEAYWEGYQDGLDRLHEQEPPQPEEDDEDWIYLPKRSAPSQAR